jgi:hypothetical protein
VPGAGVLSWVLTNATCTGGVSVATVDVVGLEMLSLHPVPPTPACFITPDDNGNAPACGGDHFYTDAWSNSGLDEWWSATWTSAIVAGEVDVNTPAGAELACLDGAASRHAPGPMSSILAGGWSHSGRTGAVVMSTTAKHAPLWTGSRAYDLPGRCSVFTVSPATVYAQHACGAALPYELRVGVFVDLTADGGISSDDLHMWRRMQFPRADVLYRTTLPYKLQLDMTSYTATHDWNVVTFQAALGYVANLSAVTDAYPQTPILVGWQGIGHDTLYPAWDAVNWRLGGAAGLAALSDGLAAASGSARSSLSYHVNADEAYSLFNGSANAEFDVRMCRVQVDHVTPWARNCTTSGDQTPDCGIRCSISKTKDNVLYGRYARYARIFDVIPPGARTIHSDAWRDVGASWEPQGADGSTGGFIPFESEQFCGQRADAAFWASHGMSMGCEGEDGQAQEFAGTVSYEYHQDGWDPSIWGRVIGGNGLGFDSDVYCDNPGGMCGWDTFADAFYLAARVYQLALTDELLGVGLQAGGRGPHRFARGGAIQQAHALRRGMTVRGMLAAALRDVPQPSTWPYGGDVITILDGKGGAFLPLVQADGATLDPDVMHAYQASAGVPPPDPGCPLFQAAPDDFLAANNTALGDWASPPYASYELDPAAPELDSVRACNASCWANASCAGWDLIKVTPTSGKTKPLCSLYTDPVGCEGDPNQWAGVKAPLPIPPPAAGVKQTWTLPLSWVGATVTAVSLTPQGPVPGVPTVTIDGRNLTLTGVMPAYAVRLTRSS